MVNSPLIRPYFLGGVPLGSYDTFTDTHQYATEISASLEMSLSMLHSQKKSHREIPRTPLLPKRKSSNEDALRLPCGRLFLWIQIAAWNALRVQMFWAKVSS